MFKCRGFFTYGSKLVYIDETQKLYLDCKENQGIHFPPQHTRVNENLGYDYRQLLTRFLKGGARIFA